MTGAQLREALEQQWKGQRLPRILQVSGLRYAWEERAPGERVVGIAVGGAPLQQDRSYSAAVNGFPADGGDGFGVLRDCARRGEGPDDAEALAACLRSLPQPLDARIDGRILLRKR